MNSAYFWQSYHTVHEDDGYKYAGDECISLVKDF